MISLFGNKVAALSALSGTASSSMDACLSTINKYSSLAGAEQTAALDFLTNNCGKAADFVQSTSHFKYVVQWMMWPATAMMIAAAVTSVIIPVVKNFMNRNNEKLLEEKTESLADESVPAWWTISGITISVTLMVWLTSSWFDMPWTQVLLAVAIQPLLIVAGLRVLGITGSGPVSLMANATQFLFGLIWPAQIRSNLSAAYISANPQATSENIVPSFWVAQRLGGRFTTLILAQLIVIPIGAFLTPLVFQMLQQTYGVGLNPGQLSAPTGLKIATLAIVMEKGLSYLPQGALQASIIAIFVGIIFELLLACRKTDSNGNSVCRFWWIPIPAAFGFALILPPSLNIAIAIGSVIAAVWRKFSPRTDGTYELFAAPLASGLIAGEAMVGSILLPVVALLMEFFS
jgi:OPT oligopeptide transporter protein